jgi:MFS family permease
VTAVCAFAAQGLAFVSLPFYFEDVLHRNQIETGFLITPWPVVVAIVAPIAGRLSDRYPSGVLGAAGLVCLCAGLVSLALMPAHPSVYAIAGRMALCGVGFGLFQSPNIKALMASAPHARSGGASGVVATSRLIGQATGAALVALCLGAAGGYGPTLALAGGAVFAGVGGIASGLRPVGSFESVWEHGRMNEAHAASSSDLCVVLTETPGGPPLWRSLGRFPDPSPFRVGYRSSFVTSFAVCGLSCWHMVQVARERTGFAGFYLSRARFGPRS